MNTQNKKQVHILHVDDDQFIFDVYKPLFEREGYKVTDVIKLDTDFVEQVISINPDLIISDITMPRIDGMEFLKGLKADKRTGNIPFVFLTNIADQKTKDEAGTLGVVDYLVKAKMRPSEAVEKIKVILYARKVLPI